MTPAAIRECEECGVHDFEEFMKERVVDNEEIFWFCKECDPGEEPAPDHVDFMDCKRDGGLR